MTTFVFTLVASLALNFFPRSGNIYVDIFVILALWIVFSTIAGLIGKDRGLTYYVSLIVGVVWSSTFLIPYRFIHIADLVMFIFFPSLFGLSLGLGSEALRKVLFGYIKGERRVGLQITRRNLLLGSLLFASILVFSLGYAYSERAIAYFDQHPWVATLLGIIATGIFTFLGGKYYERRRGEEK